MSHALAHARETVRAVFHGALRLRHLLALLVGGAGVFSLDVLRAADGGEQLGVVVLLSFASALGKFLLWGAAGVVVWRIVERVPLGGPAAAGRALVVYGLASLVLAAAVTALSQLVQAPLRPLLLAALPAGRLGRLHDSWTGGPRTELGASLALAFPWDLLTCWAIFAGIIFWQWALRAREREGQAAVLAGEVSRARLHALETQLRPHFLFNALHTISALLARDRAAALAITGRLRRLLGPLLAPEQDQPVRTLSAELAFLRDYLAIEEARFGDRLQVEIDVGAGCEAAVVPSLFLQPLVENAVRHAAAARVRGARIRVRAWRDGALLRLEVHDDGPGCSDDPFARAGGRDGGIGLANTRARLGQLYGEQHRFTFEGTAPPLGGARVSVALPYRDGATTGASPALPAAPSGPKRLWLVGWALFFVAMFVLNLVWSSARYAYLQPGPREVGWPAVLAAGSRGAAALVLLFPAVYWANHRLAARVTHAGARLALHLALALALSIAKSALARGFALTFGGPAADQAIATLVAVRIYADLLHYALMAGICHSLERYRADRAQVLHAARLDAELAAARLHAARLRLEPAQLSSTLAEVETAIERSPEEADRLVARLGDRLRLLLRADEAGTETFSVKLG